MNPQNPYQGPPYQQQPQPGQPQPLPPNPQLTPLPTQQAYPEAYPVDYLDRIAPPSQQKTLNKVTVFGLIFGFLAVIGFVVFMLVREPGTPDITTQALLSRDRAQTLMKVSNEQRLHFGTNQLTSLNASLAASFNSMSASLTELAGGKSVKNKDKKAIDAEKAYLAALSKKLNDAYLAGTLDRSYATQMSYELRSFKGMINTMHRTSKAPGVVKFYNDNMPTIDKAIKQLTEYSES